MKLNGLRYGDLPALFRDSLHMLYGDEESRQICFLIADDLLGLERSRLFLERETEVPADSLPGLEAALAALKLGTPVQYVLGKTEFCGLEFRVSPDVLIPRPETAELTMWVSEYLSEKLHAKQESQGSGGDNFRILDMGTGSGCIAITLAQRFPLLEAWALDVSGPALALAENNAQTHGQAIHWVHADIFDNTLPSRLPVFDVIVSNPPYITLSEKTLMRVNVLDYEPEVALFVGEERPLVFYEAVLDLAGDRLRPGGAIFFEINECYGDAMTDLLRTAGYDPVELRRDFRGKDRMILGFRGTCL